MTADQSRLTLKHQLPVDQVVSDGQEYRCALAAGGIECILQRDRIVGGPVAGGTVVDLGVDEPGLLRSDAVG